MRRIMKKKRDVVERRRTIPERIFFILGFTILGVWAFVMLSMFAWALMSTLKTNLDFVREPLQLPDLTDLQWSNFPLAFSKLVHNDVGFWGMLYNSLWLTLGMTIINTFWVILTGYVFAQYDFKGKSFLLTLLLFIMIVPIYGAMSAQYNLFYDLKLNDSYWYLITAVGGFNANLLITYAFFKGLPRAYREAVYVDGGSHWAAFCNIGIPMSKNIFIAFFLLGFIGQWNDYQTPLLYFDKKPTLAMGLYFFQQEIQYEANNPAYFAGAIVAMIPVLLLFIFFSDKIMGQLYTGGLKG